MRDRLRRGEKAMNDGEVRTLLEAAEYGVLGLCGEGSTPYTVPLNYVYIDNALWFYSATAGRKLETMLANPRVSFTVVASAEVQPEHFTTWFRSIHLSGRAELVKDPQEKRRILLELAAKYSPGMEEAAERYAETAYASAVVVKVIPESITGKKNPAEGGGD